MEQVWERLTRTSLVREAPCFLIGDINELRGNHEKDVLNLDMHRLLYFLINDWRLWSYGISPSWRFLWIKRESWKRCVKPIKCALDRALVYEGDPLSTYLFILCTKVLIANIRKA